MIRKVPLYAIFEVALAIGIAVLQGWPLWPVLVTLALAVIGGGEIGIALDRHYVARRTEMERDLAAAKDENAAAQRRLARAMADLARAQVLRHRVECLVEAAKERVP